LDQALASLLPQFSRSRLAQWIRDRHVELDGVPALPKTRVWGGEKVLVRPLPDPAATVAAAEAIALEIVHEDAAVLVINKPAGLVVHPGSGNWSGTLLNALLYHAPELAAVPRAGIVHRLDKDTSGLLVVAKTLPAHTALVRQLQERKVGRDYLALAHGLVASDGKIEAPIGRDPRHRTRMAVLAGGKPALTRYRVLKRFRNATLLECSLATGRTHQICVHLHSIGHPLIGDPVYRLPQFGAAPEDIAGLDRQALHAARLAFEHPVSHRRRVFKSPLPDVLKTLMKALR
jgi:23S rRNA pseudouridine1911/1915/1917 synthase